MVRLDGHGHFIFDALSKKNPGSTLPFLMSPPSDLCMTSVGLNRWIPQEYELAQPSVNLERDLNSGGTTAGYRLNFFRGSCFFRPPLTVFPPRPLPLPRPLPPSFRKGTKLALSWGSAPASPPSDVETGFICGNRYFGTCLICGCTLVGCSGLSWRRYSRSNGLSSK